MSEAVLYGEDSPYFSPMEDTYYPCEQLVSQFEQFIKSARFSDIALVGADLCICAEHTAYWIATLLTALGHPAEVQTPVIKDIYTGILYNYRIESDLPFAIDVASGLCFGRNSEGCEIALVNDQDCVYTPWRYSDNCGFCDVVRVRYGRHNVTESGWGYLLDSILFVVENPELPQEAGL